MKCPYCNATEFRYSTCRRGVQCKKCGMRWDLQEISRVIER